MKSFHVSKDIISLSEFKNNASKMLLQMQKSHRPIIVTQNGKSAGVLISPEDFDILSEQSRFIESVQNGLNDVDKQHILTDIELDKALDEASLD